MWDLLPCYTEATKHIVMFYGNRDLSFPVEICQFLMVLLKAWYFRDLDGHLLANAFSVISQSPCKKIVASI